MEAYKGHMSEVKIISQAKIMTWYVVITTYDMP